jgi:hypothetical protein
MQTHPQDILTNEIIESGDDQNLKQGNSFNKTIIESRFNEL